MATVKAVNHSRMNYLQPVNIENNTSKAPTNVILDNSVYYPIELLHYAPANQADSKLFSKLPSILLRLTQLHRIETLRKLFASELKNYAVRVHFVLQQTFDQVPFLLVDGGRRHAKTCRFQRFPEKQRCALCYESSHGK